MICKVISLQRVPGFSCTFNVLFTLTLFSYVLLVDLAPAYSQASGSFSEDVYWGGGVVPGAPSVGAPQAPSAPPSGGPGNSGNSGTGGNVGLGGPNPPQSPNSPILVPGGGSAAQNVIIECPPEGIIVDLFQDARVFQFTDQTIPSPMTTSVRRTVTRDPNVVPDGWYHFYSFSGVDSGARQTNESLYLRIPSSAVPDGAPRAANCGSDWILKDADNGPPLPAGTRLYAGTFFIDSGTRQLEVNHFCPIVRNEGRCLDLQDTTVSHTLCTVPYPGEHSSRDNSVSIIGAAVCLIPAT